MEFLGEEIGYSSVIQKALVLMFCVALSWKMIMYMCNLLNIEKDPIRVLITGAAGNVNQILNFMSFRSHVWFVSVFLIRVFLSTHNFVVCSYFNWELSIEQET